MAATPDDLTTLASAKAFLGVAGSAGDVYLQDRITRLSAQIRLWLNRGSLLSRQVARRLDGTGGSRLILPDWPVTALSSLSVCGVAVPAAPLDGFAAGYRFVAWDGDLPGDPGILEYAGGRFARGIGTVAVSYTAGYRHSESVTVPGGLSVTPAAPSGIFAADAGVVYGDGRPFIAVAASPAPGQYVAPAALAAPAMYQFAAGDAGAAVTIAYSFVPSALEQACLDAVAWYWFRQQNEMLGASNLKAMRAGDTGLAFGPSTAISSKMFIDERITDALQNFRRVFPA